MRTKIHRKARWTLFLLLFLLFLQVPRILLKALSEARHDTLDSRRSGPIDQLRQCKREEASDCQAQPQKKKNIKKSKIKKDEK
jgi:hypothetical protein